MKKKHKPRIPRTDPYDLAWKALSERFFRELIQFCNPRAFAEIDWNQGFEFLDKDLQKLRPDAGATSRWADKLVKVWRRPAAKPRKGLLGGEPGYVYLHFEFQNQRRKNLPLRMFTTNYRVFEHHQRPVASLAIFGGRGEWRVEPRFGWEFWGTRMELEFPVVQLWQYNQPQRWDELEALAQTNPFAVLVMAHLKSMETQREYEQRYVWKRVLFRMLLESQYDREDILALLRFVDWLLQMPTTLENRLDKEMEKMDTVQDVPFLTHWERRGIKKGHKEGHREGKKEGRKEGLREGKAELLKGLARHRFGELPSWAEERLDRADVETLERFSHRLLDAEQLEDIFGAP
jgi:hypothetical protein